MVGYLAIKRAHWSFRLQECRCKHADPEIARSLVLTARNYAGSQGAYFLNVCRYTKMIDEAIPRGIGTSLLGHRIMTYVYQSRCGVIDEQRWESTPGDGDMSVN